MNDLVSVILAAGEGTRMKSDLPKVLHRISGKAMLEHVLDSVLAAGCGRNYVIVGHKKEDIIKAVSAAGYGDKVVFIEQNPRLGSGHAVMQAREGLQDFEGNVVITCGDIPLLTTGTIKGLVETHLAAGSGATVLVADIENPAGYGRVILDEEDNVVKIVEDKDATKQEKEVNRINTGIYCFRSPELFDALDKVKPNNIKNEYYLTDVIGIMTGAGKRVTMAKAGDSRETAGVNTAEQLEEAEEYYNLKCGKTGP